jgi:hypothetical protein
MSAGTKNNGGAPYVSKPVAKLRSVWGYYLTAALLAALALIFLNDWRYALAAQKRWMPAAGRVTESRVEVHHGRRSDSYSTFIAYVYSANEALYGSGTRELNRYKLYFSEDAAQKDLDRHFPLGRNIDVYYNPSDPAESSLGLAGAPPLSSPIIFLLLAVGAIYLAIKE